MISDAFTFQRGGISNYFKLGALSKFHWYLVYRAISNLQYSNGTVLLYPVRVGAAEIPQDCLIPELKISATTYHLCTHLLPTLASSLYFFFLIKIKHFFFLQALFNPLHSFLEAFLEYHLLQAAPP